MNVEHYTGTWRSYMTFCVRGNVKHHEVTSYSEVVISSDGVLTLRSFSTFSKCRVFDEKDWEVCVDGKRRYLYLEKKKAFEIITLETTDLVLQDMITGEKTFFVALALWQERIRPITATDRNEHITLWSKSLTKLIKRDD